MSSYSRDELTQFPWADWKPTQEAVLAFPLRTSEILLIEKKRGLGAGKINGPGGKVDPGETPEEAAIRETREEVCLKLEHLALGGTLSFQFADGLALRCRVYATYSFSGEPQETKEAKPFWCPFDKIPYDRMWKDDILWLPMMLEGKGFHGFFTFDGDEMIDYEVKTDKGLSVLKD